MSSGDLLKTSRIEYVPAGERAERLLTGDVLLCRGTSLMSRLIAVWQGSRGPLSGYTHAAIALGPDQHLTEALIDGVKKTGVSAWDDVDYVLIRPELTLDGYESVKLYLYRVLEKEYGYGFLTIAGLAMTMLTGGKVYVGKEGSVICSGHVAAALVRSMPPAKVWFGSPAVVTPQRIAAAAGVEPGMEPFS